MIFLAWHYLGGHISQNLCFLVQHPLKLAFPIELTFANTEFLERTFLTVSMWSKLVLPRPDIPRNCTKNCKTDISRTDDVLYRYKLPEEKNFARNEVRIDDTSSQRNVPWNIHNRKYTLRISRAVLKTKVYVPLEWYSWNRYSLELTFFEKRRFPKKHVQSWSSWNGHPKIGVQLDHIISSSSTIPTTENPWNLRPLELNFPGRDIP